MLADLGFENAEEMLSRTKLAVAIKDVIKDRKLTQVQAAKLMAICGYVAVSGCKS